MMKCLVLVALLIGFTACTPEMKAAMQKAWQDAQKNRTNFYAPQYNYRMPTYTNPYGTVGPVAQTVQPYNLPANPNRTVGPIAQTTQSYSSSSSSYQTVGPVASSSSYGGGSSYSSYSGGAGSSVYAASLLTDSYSSSSSRKPYDDGMGSSSVKVKCDKCLGDGYHWVSGNYGQPGYNKKCYVCGGSGYISEREQNLRTSVGVYGR